MDEFNLDELEERLDKSKKILIDMWGRVTKEVARMMQDIKPIVQTVIEMASDDKLLYYSYMHDKVKSKRLKKKYNKKYYKRLDEIKNN